MKFNLCLLNIAALLSVGVTSKSGSRIIGGSDAEAGEFPYVAAIHVKTPNSTFFCGGFLTRNQWIITSANCVNNAVSFTIQLGSPTLTEDDSNRVTVESTEFYVHPDFNPETIEADVGLIKLQSTFNETDYIQNSFFLDTNFTLNNTHTVLGWGQTSDSNTDLSERLQYVDVEPLETDECKQIYGDKITDFMVCVRGNSTEGTCVGDNGGPLVVRMGPFDWVVAIASFISGNGCESTDPSGFTKVTPYFNWVRSVMYGEK